MKGFILIAENLTFILYNIIIYGKQHQHNIAKEIFMGLHSLYRNSLHGNVYDDDSAGFYYYIYIYIYYIIYVYIIYIYIYICMYIIIIIYEE